MEKVPDGDGKAWETLSNMSISYRLYGSHARFHCQLQPYVGICQKKNLSIKTRVDDYSENQNDVFTNPVRVLLRSLRNGIQLTYLVFKTYYPM